MKILIDITPTFSRWVKDEKAFVEMFRATLQNELGKADLDGELNNVQQLPEIKQT